MLSQQVPRSYQDGVFEKQCCSRRAEEAIWSLWDPSRSGLRQWSPIQKHRISRICERARFQAYTKANEERERVIQTVKNIWRKNKDRTTPLPGIELPPTQRLMGRRLRNNLPMIDSLFHPASVKQKDVSRYLKKTKKDQKKKHHDDMLAAK